MERERGGGGRARVYLAGNLKHRRFVALKVLSPALAASLGADRFLREIELAARLQHPHIVTVFDSGDAGGILWYTMPYVEGETLRARLERERQLPLDVALRIAVEAARALEFAHQHGVLHRDVKPENLLLTTDGSTMVADFGIAGPWGEVEKVTQSGVVVGTPAYMSPEQAAGERALDARTDVYALGCVLYEMLAGEMPYSGPNAQAVLAKRLSEPAPSLRTTRALPVAIERTVARALARTPADRYASAAEFARALQSIDAPARPILQRRWLAAAVVVLLLAGVAAAIRFPAGAKGPAGPGFPAGLPFPPLSERKGQEEFNHRPTHQLITPFRRIGGNSVDPRPPADIEAYDLYLKGRFAWNQRTRIGMPLAVGYLEQAVARDSAFALAWAALADAYLLVIPYAGTSQEVDWPKAKAVAARALAIDSTIGEAYTALAYGTMVYDWDWSAAEANFRRAIAVDPAYPTGHQWYGNFLWSQGRFREAMVQMREALRLDPLSLIIGDEVAQTYYLQHQFGSAEAQVPGTLQLDPNYAHSIYGFGMIHLGQHRDRETRDVLQRAEQLGGVQEDLAGALASAYAQAGDRTVSARYTAGLGRRVAAKQVGPFALALAFTGQGDLTRAVSNLDRAITIHDPFLPEDFFDPQLDRLRADPRFAAVEAHMQGGGGPSH